MKTEEDGIPLRIATVRGRPDAVDGFAAAGLGTLAALSDPAHGIGITAHRSSWVRRAQIDTSIYYIKTYDYPSWRDRWRGALRNTWAARSRAAAEFDALTWLAAHDLHAPSPVLVAEDRRLGWLARAVLVTRDWPGRRLDDALTTATPTVRTRLLTALDAWVDALHGAGFRDRNLDPRNILVREDAANGFAFAKLDSPRHRIVRGAGPDRWTAEDRARLGVGLAALGHVWPVAN